MRLAGGVLHARRGALAAALVLVVIMAVAPAAAGAAGGGAALHTVAVARTMSLRGSSPAAVRVTVPDGASIDLTTPIGGDPVAAAITGEGRLVGFHLVPEQAGQGEGITVLRLPQRLRTIGYHHVGYMSGVDCGNGVCPLPAGAYLLYLVADGTPVDVSLTFDGVDGAAGLCDASACSGSAAVQLTPVGHALRTPQPQVIAPAPTPGPVYRTVAHEETFANSALLLMLTQRAAHSDTLPSPGPGGPVGAGLYGTCFYRAPLPPQGIQPGCVDGDTPGAGAQVTYMPNEQNRFSEWGALDARWLYGPQDGVYAMGAWQAHTGAADRFSLTVLRLDRPAEG
jgi:hypothetical protein